MKPAELQCMRVANASAIRRTATDSGPAYVVDEPTGDSEFDAVRIGARTVAACVRAGWLRRIDNVEAELYRANAIENFETCTIRLTTRGDVPCLIALTHASNHNIDPEVDIRTEQAKLIYSRVE